MVDVINANDIFAKTEMIETYFIPKRNTRTKPNTIPVSLGFFHRVKFSFTSGVSHIFLCKSQTEKREWFITSRKSLESWTASVMLAKMSAKNSVSAPVQTKKYRAPPCQDKCWIYDSEQNLTWNHWKSLVISPYDKKANLGHLVTSCLMEKPIPIKKVQVY